MNWTLKTESKDIENGCRNAIKDRPDSLFAGIYNASGYGVANIDRLGRLESDYLHDHITDNDEPHLHATTDEEWQSIVRCIRASPDLLAALSFALPVLRLAATQRPIFDGEGINILLEAADEVAAAIEKATGEAD